MGFFKEELLKVKAFVFDVDGVLSEDTSPLNEDGDPVRTSNVKDGFAIRTALASGFPVAVITGGFVDRVRKRHEHLGVQHYYDKVRDKVKCLNDFSSKTGIHPDNILFMGDDLVDYSVMLACGITACPKDAVPEIKEISGYVSDINGGKGCVRDVIEQTLRAQGKWFTRDLLIKNSF